MNLNVEVLLVVLYPRTAFCHLQYRKSREGLGYFIPMSDVRVERRVN